MLKVEVEITTSIVAWAALITTILQFLSGMYVPLRVMVSSSLVLIQICLKIQKRGNTSDISAFPFIAAIISCSLWLKYGILRDDHTLIIVNTIGLVLQICYLLFYYYRCVNKGPLNFNLLIAVSILFPLLVYVKFFVEDQETAVSRTGLMACTAGVVFCASPLASLAQVIRTKSTDSLPYHLICSTFLGSSLWVLYGSLISDQFVMIPNIFGALIASLQLLLFGIYPKRNTYMAMTITYQFDVSTSTFCGFTKLLTKWRGSIYKLVYQEMLIYTVAYTIITLAYRLAMTDAQKRLFEKVSLYCARYLDLIPLSFVLGFYVTFVVQRWWSQFTTIPWPDRIMNTVAMYVHGTDERGRLIRRTLMRYMNLSFVLVLSSISVAVKKRFPTLDHLVEAGFMTSEEKYLFNKIYAKVNKYWIPMCWFINLLEESRKEGRLQDGAPVKHILEEVNRFRSRTSLLWCFDWVTVPIVYTQVVTWATHLFFIVCLVGRQYLDPLQQYPGHDIDMYVPFFTLLQFFFYMGWLKVAEQLINPFGEDEDDFETNWLIDRHIQVSYLGVDELYGKLPRIQKDIFWDDNEPEVPYTAASLIHKIPNYCGSTMHLKIPGYTDVSVSETTEPTKSSNIEKTEGFFQRIKKNFSNRRNIEDSAGNKLWKKVSMKNLQAKPLGRRDTRDRTRTLGRRESLMGGEFLAMLNRGRKKRISDASIHSQILSRNNVLNENSSHHVITMDCPSSSEQNHGVLHYLFPSSRRGSLNPQISIDAVGDSDKDSLYNFREGDASSRRSSLGATPLTSNRSSDNGLFVSNVPKPYKSVFNEGHALRPLLARLSEIENENENESEVSSSSVPSPENNVINPEIGKKLESYNAHDSD